MVGIKADAITSNISMTETMPSRPFQILFRTFLVTF